jgi:AraC-like DNA-binding protein
MTDSKTIRPQFVGGIPGHVEDADYFYLDTHPKDPLDLTVVCGGWEQCAPDFVTQRANYPYWFMIYTTEGQGELQVGRRRWPLDPGTLSGFSPGSPHRYQSDPVRPMEQLFVTFQGPGASRLFSQSGLENLPAQRVGDAPAFLALFEQLLQTGMEHGSRAQAICGNFLHIILLKLAEGSLVQSPQRPGAWQTYQTCQRYLNTHFTLIKTPAEVAEACDIDVRYLAALFKRFGTASPQQTLLRLKLMHAADLLLTTPLPIKDVAARVGFEDPYHFSRRFKQFFTNSPKQYRADHLLKET